VIQTILLVGVAVSGMFGPAWGGLARVATTVVGLLAMAAGAVLGFAAIRGLGPALSPLPGPRRGAQLIDSGPYARIRHPIYAGVALGTVGWGLLTASPVSIALALATSLFYAAKAVREEVWLVDAFPGYEAYRRRTHRLIPGVW
jgi:protein-S-isoprenylcysteine O-methyltransferase Ste14